MKFPFWLLSLFLALFLVSFQYSSAKPLSIPESRMHQKLKFRGTKLPDKHVVLDSSPDFALYIGRGTWDTGVEHLKMFLTEKGYTYETVQADDIKNRKLRRESFWGLIMPGGESWSYLADLGTEGADVIRQFVNDGGGYVGICAGAFYAVSDREGGYKTGPYGIGLLKGVAYDGTALHTAPFKEGMLDFDSQGIPFMQGLKPLYKMVLFGGPSFRVSPEEVKLKNVRVPMRFQGIHEPAMVQFRYGDGRVYLSGPHLEIEEDRTEWGKEYSDPESDWPVLQRFVDWTLGRESNHRGTSSAVN